MRRGRKRAITGFGALLVLSLVFSVFAYFNFKTVQVSGDSMLPKLKDGERVVVSKAYWLIGAIRKNDIVVLRDEGPTGFIIKRVKWMPGERVDWRWAPESHDIMQGEYRVPDGEVYVLGDNRDHSEDSRKFGAVPISEIIGKVVVWP